MSTLDNLSQSASWSKGPNGMAQALPAPAGQVSRHLPLNTCCTAMVLNPKDPAHSAVSLSVFYWVSPSSDFLCSSWLLGLSLWLGTIPTALTCWSDPLLHFFLCPRARPSSRCTNFPVQSSVFASYIKPKQQLSYSPNKTIMTNFCYSVYHNLNISLCLFSLCGPQT